MKENPQCVPSMMGERESNRYGCSTPNLIGSCNWRGANPVSSQLERDPYGATMLLVDRSGVLEYSSLFFGFCKKYYLNWEAPACLSATNILALALRLT